MWCIAMRKKAGEKENEREDIGYNHNSLSVSRWGSLSCRWWPGWRSRPHCTRGHCRSGWSCWWTGCKCCWYSRRSCSCPSPSLHSQKPTQRWNPNHYDPGEVHSDRKWQSKTLSLDTILIQSLIGIKITEEQINLKFYREKGPIQMQHISQTPVRSLSKLNRAKHRKTEMKYKKALYDNSSLW